MCCWMKQQQIIYSILSFDYSFHQIQRFGISRSGATFLMVIKVTIYVYLFYHKLVIKIFVISAFINTEMILIRC